MSPAKTWTVALILILNIKIGSGQSTRPDQTKSVYGIDVAICSSTHQCQLKNRCGMPPQDGDTCGCDAACEYYGDCCYDYSSACNSSELIPSTEYSSQLQCVTRDSIFSDGFYTIGLCRDDSNVDIETISKCEKPALNDILLTIIVSDADDNIYKNVYCALCNGVPISELTAWEITFTCRDEGHREELHERIETVYEPGATNPPPVTTKPPSLIHKQLGNALACDNFHFGPPQGKPDLRRNCNSKAKLECDETYSNERVVHACRTKYKGIVYGKRGVYMNPHCAVCNNDYFYICYNKTNSVKDDFRVTPLTMIVDFSLESSVSVRSPYETYVITEGVSCAAGEVYDPFTEKCLQVKCKSGFTLRGFNCVAAVTSSNCGGAAMQVPNKLFCLCKLQEQSMHIEYQYVSVEDNFKSVDIFTEGLISFGVNYSKKTLKYTNMTNIRILITTIDCQLAQDISDLAISVFNKTIDTELSVVTLKQNCSTNATPTKLLCDYDRFLLTDEVSVNFENTTRTVSNGNFSTLVPNEGYILEIVHQVANESSICSSFSISTCKVCQQLQLDESLFLHQSNGTLVHEWSGTVFEENEFVLSNYSNASTVVVCSFLNQTGFKIVQTQFFNYDGALLIISVVGTILSLIGLLITIILRVIFEKLRTLSGKIILNISISLFFALLLTLVQGYFTEWKRFCEIVAAILHYLWLVCFLWMNAMAFEFFRTFRVFRASPRSENSQKKTFVTYFIYSWGVPAAYVGIIVGMTFCECTSLNLMYGDDSVCWIRDEVASFFVFGIPLAVILLPNLILFVATIRGIHEARRSTAIVSDKTQYKQLTEEMVIYIRISTVMGLSWAFGFLASFIDHVILWYLFTILNSLQGVFIFLAFNITHSIRKIPTSGKQKQTSLTSRTRDTSLSTPTSN
ncbi:uncharacterized protein LOC117117531 [Anneissia japonica]|uniref:uncharacterized protein LOC117117531 n=1 Tax=Anneissia japonica TaxID=1529436 RepID=UPI001425A546|nr:uncharacterized protein LOC117117531 [Anneissia japonica]